MTANKMIPTNGKRPKGLKDEDYIHIQYRNNSMDIIKVCFVGWWNHTYKQDDDIIAYSLIQQPAPYVPEPDYSKWIGKVCAFSNVSMVKPEAYGVLTRYVQDNAYPFEMFGAFYKNCRPVTADEIVKE